MEITNNTTMELSLKEIVAVIVRGGKKIIAVALAFAILFGGVSMLNQSAAAEASEQAYHAQLEEYEKSREELNLEIEKLNRDLEKQEQYNENSQLMQIDPYNKITTTVVFAISGVKLDQVTDPFKITETPISYIISLIQAQYAGVWNGLELSQVAAGTRYEGVGDKYLREVIKLEILNGGVLQLTVEGSSAQECEQIAKGLYAQLEQSRETVIKASYEHSFVMLNDVITKISINTDLERKQRENVEKLDGYRSSIEAKEAELEALAVPSYDAGDSVVVNAVLGAVVGALVAMLALVGAHFLTGRVSGAKQLTSRYGLVHFGSVTKKGGIFKRLGYGIMGEKLWSDRQQALAYISTNSINSLPENAEVTVVSSLSCLDENVCKEIADALSVQGRKAVFVADVAHNPEALAAIARSNGVVLAECAFASRNAAVKELLAIAKELNKPVYGFVMQ